MSTDFHAHLVDWDKASAAMQSGEFWEAFNKYKGGETFDWISSTRQWWESNGGVWGDAGMCFAEILRAEEQDFQESWGSTLGMFLGEENISGYWEGPFSAENGFFCAFSPPSAQNLSAKFQALDLNQLRPLFDKHVSEAYKNLIEQRGGYEAFLTYLQQWPRLFEEAARAQRGVLINYDM